MNVNTFSSAGTSDDDPHIVEGLRASSCRELIDFGLKSFRIDMHPENSAMIMYPVDANGNVLEQNPLERLRSLAQDYTGVRWFITSEGHHWLVARAANDQPVERTENIQQSAPNANQTGAATVVPDLPVPTMNTTVTTTTSGPGNPPRPMNSWMIFRDEQHRILKSQNPDISVQEISTFLSQVWRNMSEVQKDHYRELAEAAKAKHHQMYPDYKYSPRKPGQKKKRQSRKGSKATGSKTAALRIDVCAAAAAAPASTVSTVAATGSGSETFDFNRFPDTPTILSNVGQDNWIDEYSDNLDDAFRSIAEDYTVMRDSETRAGSRPENRTEDRTQVEARRHAGLEAEFGTEDPSQVMDSDTALNFGSMDDIDAWFNVNRLE